MGELNSLKATIRGIKAKQGKFVGSLPVGPVTPKDTLCDLVWRMKKLKRKPLASRGVPKGEEGALRMFKETIEGRGAWSQLEVWPGERQEEIP